jgi:hypothetical protein
MDKLGVTDERSLAFIRGYEVALVETIEKALGEARPR